MEVSVLCQGPGRAGGPPVGRDWEAVCVCRNEARRRLEYMYIAVRLDVECTSTSMYVE